MANGIDIDVGQSLLVGPQGPQGEIGPRGYGIKTIAKTGTDGLVDTYTVTFDDDRTATFEVTNGRAISSIDLTSTVENVDTYTITYNDGTTSTFTVTNSNVSREEFEEAVEVINSEMNTKEAEGEKVKLTGVATTNLGITVQGNTYQETTTGKNIFNYTRTTKTITTNGVTSTINDDGSITLDGTATALTWFVLNSAFDWESGDYTMYLTDSKIVGFLLYSDVGATDTIKQFNVPTTKTKDIALEIEPGTSFNNLTISPMILKGSYTLENIGDYEPYTNGASPNPDFPQEVKVVTGDNTIKVEYKQIIELTEDTYMNAGVTSVVNNGVITSTGTATDNASVVEIPLITPIKIKANKTYKIALNNETIMSSAGCYMFINNDTSKKVTFQSQNAELTLNEKTDLTITKLSLRFAQGNTASVVLRPILNYDAPVSQTYPINLGTLELAGIGDYKDYIHKSGTDWFVHRAIGRVIFDGSESWEAQWSGNLWAYKGYISDILKSTTNDDLPYLYSNLFASDTQSLVYRHGPYGICRRTSNPQVIIRNDYTTSLADFKTWLSTHNTTVYYPKATPTEEQITDTTLIQQLEALSQATAKGNNFIVTTETENLKPILKVQYKESTRYKADDLENRVEKLEEQIKHAGHVYGVRRKRENNSSSEWERTDDAIGLVANATHDGTEVQNDFDNLSPWKDIISFNLDLETGHKKAYYGDPDFKFDGSNGDVYTHIPDIYYRVWHDDEYDYVQIADFAESEFEKCDKFDIQRYKTGIVNDVLHSYSNMPAAGSKNISNFRTMVHELGEDYCLLDWRYFVIQLLYLVEYADYNSQAKLGNGFSSMRHNQADVSLLAETNTHRFVVNTNAGNAFVVGQTVSVGTANEKNDIAESRKIIAITDYDSGGVTGKSITLDGATFTTTITSVIWSSAQHSGQCDLLGMKSGCLSNDNKHEVTYRGIEGLYGNIFQFVDGINIKDNRAYVCYNPNDYVSDKFETPYEAMGYINATANGYSKALGFDINNPLIRFPIEIGGGSNTYMTDYYSRNTGNRVARVGGALSNANATYSGPWFWTFYIASSNVSWDSGARVIKYK